MYSGGIHGGAIYGGHIRAFFKMRLLSRLPLWHRVQPHATPSIGPMNSSSDLLSFVIPFCELACAEVDWLLPTNRGVALCQSDVASVLIDGSPQMELFCCCWKRVLCGFFWSEMMLLPRNGSFICRGPVSPKVFLCGVHVGQNEHLSKAIQTTSAIAPMWPMNAAGVGEFSRICPVHETETPGPSSISLEVGDRRLNFLLGRSEFPSLSKCDKQSTNQARMRRAAGNVPSAQRSLALRARPTKSDLRCQVWIPTSMFHSSACWCVESSVSGYPLCGGRHP